MTTSDGWTADNTKGSFLGMMAHWIDVTDGKWTLQSEVVCFQPISGEHSGGNLGKYFVGLCDHVRITSEKISKVCQLRDRDKSVDKLIRFGLQLQSVTLDNASNNNMSCEMIEHQHNHRQLQWNAAENQLPYVPFFFFLRQKLIFVYHLDVLNTL